MYGLRRSPRHWYNMITAILTKMGLRASPHDPCLFNGVVTSDDDRAAALRASPPDAMLPPLPKSPSNPTAEVQVGLYVDDFVFYSEDPAQEEKFRVELAKNIKVDFMGDVDYFLGTAFTWLRHDNGHVSVHLCQSAFTEHTAHRFAVSKMKRVPNMTPYRPGLPIDSIPPPSDSDPDLKRRTKVYQSIVGSINWLATCTRPDIAPCLTFLSTYSCKPNVQHYRAAVHALKYLYSTSEYGISFHSDAPDTLEAFNHFPDHHDKEAYKDASPPAPADCHRLTAFSDACWGGQFGNAVANGTPLELFKYRSLSGFVICRCGGPIAWKAVRQDQTALSSCEAEIVATNECIGELVDLRHRAADLGMSDAEGTTTVYNDNQGAVDWAASITNKGIKHINLRENKVREVHANGTVAVTHIPGAINGSDIFTKEMKDAAHFRRLRDCMMVSRAAFLRHGHAVPSHVLPHSVLPYFTLPTAT